MKVVEIKFEDNVGLLKYLFEFIFGSLRVPFRLCDNYINVNYSILPVLLIFCPIVMYFQKDKKNCELAIGQQQRDILLSNLSH